jgi:hypothetical protein
LTTSTTEDVAADDIWDEVLKQADEPFSPPARTEPKPVSVTPGDQVEAWARDIILDHELNRPRSRQNAIGPSGVGEKCDRRIAMQLAGVTPVHFADPLKAWVGTGAHLMLDEAVSLRDRQVGRYLTEHPVTYRGIPGSVDVFDRITGRVGDWKSKELAKIKRLRKKGVMDEGYRIQQNIYAAGLIAQGEVVNEVALIYIPTNGELADIYVQIEPVDIELADRAIDRIEAIEAALLEGKPAEEFRPTTSALCGWCPFHNPLIPTSAKSCSGGIRFVTDVSD